MCKAFLARKKKTLAFAVRFSADVNMLILYSFEDVQNAQV